MERNERYDPQDIEKLMQEKSFSELLSDEQAFVLKHLENEAEYEQVRRTLFSLQKHIEDEGTVAPRPELRRELISAFKEEQRKGYRYWLNSIAGFFFPQQGHAQWAPVLRFAGIAAIVGITFFTYQQWGGLSSTNQVAENKPAEEARFKVEDNDASAEGYNGENGDDKKIEQESLNVEGALKEGLADNTYQEFVDKESGQKPFESAKREQVAMLDDATFDMETVANEVTKDLSSSGGVVVAIVEEDEEEPATLAQETVPVLNSPSNNSNADAALLEELDAVEWEGVARAGNSDFRSNDSMIVSDVTTSKGFSSGAMRADVEKKALESATVDEAVVASGRKAKRRSELNVEKDKKTLRNSRNLAQDPQLIGLLVQAW